MSSENTCPTCGFDNTQGSKFCNNCGSKLPMSSHIVCPDCDTANPSDRIFCDNCGSRLVEDHTGPIDDPIDETPTPAGKEAFSLPMRESEDVGELDPSKAQEWLQFGKDADASSAADRTQSHQPSDELPDWLIHDSDPEPIFNAPTSISTEFYQDLLDRAEDVPEPDDLLHEANDANLPDWLAEPDEEGVQEGKTAPPDDDPDKALPPEDFYSPQEEPAEERAGSAEINTGPEAEIGSPEDEITEPITRNDSDEGGLTAWLGDLDELVPASITPTESSAPLDMDDLLADLQIGDPGDEPATDTGWLSELGAGDNEIESEPPETSAEVNWSGEESAAEEPPPSPEEPSDGLTAWLSDLSQISDTPDSEQGIEDEQIDIDHLLLEEPVESEEEPLPDWLSDLGPAQTEHFGRQKEETVEPGLADGTPDWMDALGPLETNILPDQNESEEVEEELGDEIASEPAAADSELSWLENAQDTFSNLFEIGPSEEPLPDWLADVAEEGSMYVGSGQTGALDADLTESLSSAANAAAEDLDWLVQTGRLTPVDEDPLTDETAVPIPPLPLDIGAEDGAAADSPEPAEEESDWDAEDEQLDGIPMDDMPDWLSDLRALETGELKPEPEEGADETPVSEELVTPAAEADETEPDLTSEEIQDEEEMALASDAVMLDSALFDSSDALEEMPDWIGQLDSAPPDTEEEESPLILTEDLPDWIVNMRPSEGMISSSLPGIMNDSDEELTGSLEGISEDFAGADLPEWLRDAGIATDHEPSMTSLEGDESLELDIPDWLQEERDELATSVVEEDDFSEQLLAAASEDWGAFIHDLPPSDPLAEAVPEIELPEWILALKPVELRDKTTAEVEQDVTPVEDEMLQTNSPLLGIRRVIAIEPAISMPRVARPMFLHEITTAQLQQAALLRQILSQQAPSRKISPVSATVSLSIGVRSVLALLLLVAALVGLRGPFNLVDLNKTPVPAYATNVNEAINAAAGMPVLVAIDFTPSLAGELTAPAQMVVDMLIANGSPVILTSQQAAGTAIAASLTTEQTIWGGYLPGEAMGLRQLGNCVVTPEACTHIGGKPFETVLQSNLPNLALIIVVTGDREILVNWIEQVGMPHDIPIVAGVTQSLAPIAAPYYATGQLSGYLGGLMDTAVFSNTYRTDPQADITAKMNAQLTSQLLVVLILLTGLFTYGLKGSSAKQDAAPLPAPEIRPSE